MDLDQLKRSLKDLEERTYLKSADGYGIKGATISMEGDYACGWLQTCGQPHLRSIAHQRVCNPDLGDHQF